MKIFLITHSTSNGQRITSPQRGTTRQGAISIVASTGATVFNAVEVDATDFNALWPFIGSRLDIYDDEAQSMALRLMAKGINTWQQWINHEEPKA